MREKRVREKRETSILTSLFNFELNLENFYKSKYLPKPNARLHPSSVQRQMKPLEKMAEAAAKAANMLCKQYATKLAGVAFISYD